jgi:choloylglycine hydrolase
MINLEPRNGQLLVIENPIGVVTNAPDFEREIKKLESYMELTTLSNSLNGISTGNFSGKPVFPGGFTPTSRFIRATILKERAITPANEHENVIETWHILNAVTVPKSDGRSDTYTIYRSAVEVNSRTLYLQRYEDFAITSYRFPD